MFEVFKEPNRVTSWEAISSYELNDKEYPDLLKNGARISEENRDFRQLGIALYIRRGQTGIFVDDFSLHKVCDNITNELYAGYVDVAIKTSSGIIMLYDEKYKLHNIRDFIRPYQGMDFAKAAVKIISEQVGVFINAGASLIRILPNAYTDVKISKPDLGTISVGGISRRGDIKRLGCFFDDNAQLLRCMLCWDISRIENQNLYIIPIYDKGLEDDAIINPKMIKVFDPDSSKEIGIYNGMLGFVKTDHEFPANIKGLL